MNIIAVIKHISIKNSNYDAAYDYLTTKHDEFTSKLIWDERKLLNRGHPLVTDFEKDFIHRFIVSQQNSYRKSSSKRPNLTIPAQESISRITDISTCEKRNRVLHTSHFSCRKTALICVTEKDELIFHNEFVF